MSVTSILGSASATSIFSLNSSGTTVTQEQQTAQTTVNSARREINRIRGYKLQLTPADNQRLSKIQERIQVIETKASDGTIRPDELTERSELYLEADAIIGKPTADVESDSVLSSLNSQIETLREPTLNASDAKRLKLLENYKSNLETALSNNSDNSVNRARIQSVVKQINEINVPRFIHEMSVSEQKQYDVLVERVNEHAGEKVLLNAKESKRVYDLEQSIQQLQSILPADTSGQPTAASVSRAYARLA